MYEAGACTRRSDRAVKSDKTAGAGGLVRASVRRLFLERFFGSAQCETGVGLVAKTAVLQGKQSTQAQGCSAAAPHGKAVNGRQFRGDWAGREESRPHVERGASVNS